MKVRTDTASVLGRLAHADARAAGGLEDPRARRDDGRERAVLREHREHLPRAGRNAEAHVRVDVFPLSAAATVMRSLSEEFVQEPMSTWSTLLPASSAYRPYVSGLWGHAAMGSSGGEVDVDDLVVDGALSAAKAFQRLFPALGRRKCPGTSSLGKIDVVAPSSAPMLVMVARSGTVRVLTPSPEYSKILPTPPLTVRRLEELEDDVLGAGPTAGACR